MNAAQLNTLGGSYQMWSLIEDANAHIHLSRRLHYASQSSQNDTFVSQQNDISLGANVAF